MTRILLVACVVLAALCAFQWTLMRRLRVDLAAVNYDSAREELHARREEVARVMTWLDASFQREPSPRSLCDGGKPNTDPIELATSDLYVYLRARRNGVTEAEGRQLVLDSRLEASRR
jgi:type II secretory pathway component PulJ